MSFVVWIFADGIRSSWRTRRRDAVSQIVKLLRYGQVWAIMVALLPLLTLRASDEDIIRLTELV